ncbi:MAG: AAA family ATPase [Bacteroidota bacterium]|nr:AAA family ATPase [Bacteroidota bacterium]
MEENNNINPMDNLLSIYNDVVGQVDGSQSTTKDSLKLTVNTEVKKSALTMSLKDMIVRVKSEPPIQTIYSGITDNSLGFIVGPPKCGKTIFCENLALSIAAGVDDYLGLPININNKQVLFISLEEFYRDRTTRNEKQVSHIINKGKGDEWIDNITVVTENMPRYFNSDAHWKVLEDVITDHNPGIVFIDSLSRMYSGSIEESSVAMPIMKRLREITNKLKVSIVVIHHTSKLNNAPITIYSVAGSRIIGQEADFIIGINKTNSNNRYIKDVAFRYAPENDETVKRFKINDNLWLETIDVVEEYVLLGENDGRKDNANSEILLEYIIKTNNEKGEVKSQDIITDIVDAGTMSRQTAFTQLGNLVNVKKITKVAKGKYKLL